MYYFHLSDANLIKAYEAGVAGWRLTTNMHAYTTNTCMYIHTQTDTDAHTYTRTETLAG